VLHVKSQYEIYTITINDMIGNVIAHYQTQEKHTILNLSAYRAGMYILRIENENGLTYSKINIQ
jgi:hypothetical protein